MDGGDQNKERGDISLAHFKMQANTSKSQEEGIAMEAKVSQCGTNTIRSDGDMLITYTHLFWARARTKTCVKIKGLE